VPLAAEIAADKSRGLATAAELHRGQVACQELAERGHRAI
jgi:hypothetical protein